MSETRFKKDEIYLLPVKEIRTENTRSFYIVEADGMEYAIPLFAFQKNDPTPEQLSCLVKDVHDDMPVFTQDFAPIISRFYEEAKVYPFWVRNDFTQIPNGYYEVADWNGLFFRLQYYGRAKLSIRQRIECRVRSIRGNKLCLELVTKDAASGRSLPLLLLEDILEAVGASRSIIVWLKKLFVRAKVFKEANEAFMNDNEEWIIIAIESLSKSMDVWVGPGHRRNRLYLELFKSICIYLLEDSDTLAQCAAPERSAYQAMLSAALENADIYLDSVRLIDNHEHIPCIDSYLRKMQQSGYLYHPERKLRKLMCIFNLQPDIVEEKMQVIFDTILKGNKENWKTEPFRSAFIQMLSLFIEKKRESIDKLASIENDEMRENLSKLIKALAIQLLLANEKDNFERPLSRAMLYRYLTYIKGSNSSILTEKAFDSLTDAEQYKLEFGWNEVNDMTLLAIRLSSGFGNDRQKKTTVMQTYNGANCKLQIMNGNIFIQSSEKTKQVPCLPEDLLPWHHIQIFLPDTDNLSWPANTHELAKCQKCWKDIEYGLINSPALKPVRKNKKLKAETGDEVYIRIVHQDPADPDYFICRIEDDAYYGEGRLNVRNIVRYNIYANESAFFDENGRPYLLKAKVLSVNSGGMLNFTMTDYINDFVRECVQTGDVVKCIVLDLFNNSYLCVSEVGYSLQVPVEETEPLKPGECIEVSVSNYRQTNVIDAEFERKVVGTFTLNEAFADLICSYADDKVYEDAVREYDLEQPEVTMEKSYVEELIHIIDRMAIQEKDYFLTYNYLAFTRILALMIRNRDWAAYFNERMRLIRMLQLFVINGKIDEERLKELGKSNRDMINNYPVLETKLLELQIVGCMDCPEHDGFVWNVISSEGDKHLRQLAQLVISYNSLKNFNMMNEREAIRNKINEVLNVGVKQPALSYWGEENLHQEFKTSIVYPPDNHMKADVKRQTQEIMQVICGFLNADGGTLYLGVNDQGYASGLEQDLEYLKMSKDQFDLYVRNNIVSSMGNEANACIDAYYPEAGRKLVYALKITPCSRPVRMKGTVYQRQGSSTWPLLGNALEAFLAARETGAESRGTENLQTAAAGAEEGLAESNPEEENAKNDSSLCKTTAGRVVETSRIRENPVHSWNDNFGADTVCYLHFLPGHEYMITDGEYWEETELTLAVKTDEKYIILVYETGEVLKVPVAELMDKRKRTPYKRCQRSRLFFACPSASDDALLYGVTNNTGQVYLRLDEVSGLKEGKMMDLGEQLTTVEHLGVVQCEIMKPVHIPSLKKIYNLRKTQIGNVLSSQWGYEELEYLKKIGIEVRE
ncbi:hypothetical protein B5F34_06140 [Mediterranea sp. An20]|uniref:AlbA family DNA-binding domain-containing protein n=1 Tax=Mediterranea sp. An20 TaxID=1965586 RepID=UPI000B389B49|nr:ATP-binding protein [Mediterranea sp. An20]OUP09630.1 hypothetical protein B5F34_06140 [Mediterranea sp. An20]